jgi:hypothetical protein
MISEENIAAAQIAQIFGSELMKAQQSARTDSGSVPDFVKMNPAQFLTQQNTNSAAAKQRERELMRRLQQEAESAYPISESPQALPAQANSSATLPTATSQIPNHQTSHVVGRVTSTVPSLFSTDSVMERIANSLELIAKRLETVDVLLKKKKVKRNKTNVNESITQ